MRKQGSSPGSITLFMQPSELSKEEGRVRFFPTLRHLLAEKEFDMLPPTGIFSFSSTPL